MSGMIDVVRRARSPREAIELLAHSIDELREQLETMQSEASAWDSWGEPEASEPEDGLTFEEAHAAAVAAMQNEEAHDIMLPTPSPEKMDRRRLFERQQLKLTNGLGTEEDWNEVYAKGGPLWLYNGNREVFMSYDYPVRQQMIADIEEDAPDLAYQVSLDALKQPAGEPDLEGGSGALAVGWVSGKKR